MSLLFQVRGTQLPAYYSKGGSQYAPFRQNDAADPTVVDDATTGVIGGKLIDINDSGKLRGIAYLGGKNVGSNSSNAFALLMRFKGAWTDNGSGGPTVQQALFAIGSAILGAATSPISLAWKTDRTFVGYWGFNQVLFLTNSVLTGSTKSMTTGAVHEVLWTWNGQANSPLELYVDGVLVHSLNINGTYGDFGTTVRRLIELKGTIIIGGYSGASNVSQLLLNEFCIWDEYKNYGVGAGQLDFNRTSFIAASNIDESVSTDPGVGNVRLNTAYTAAGVAKTGTLVVPTLANTKIGVAGDGGVGTYRGQDRWTALPVENVDTGIAYLADGVDLVGASDDPDPADVREGVEFDNETKTGTLKVPAPEDVREGVETDDTVGSLDLPVQADVRENVTYDGGSKTGTLKPVTNIMRALTLQAKNSPTGTSGVVITAGDRVVLDLTLLGDDGLPASLTGATFETKVLGYSGSPVVIPNSQHVAATDQVASKGKATLTLLAANTTAFKNQGARLEIITKVTIGSDVLHFHGKAALQVLSNLPGEE
jgi:hypothetical protein